MQALLARPSSTDIHCVTRWSKVGAQWRGVPVDTLLDQVAGDAPRAGVLRRRLHHQPATEDVTGGKAVAAAFSYDGAPLEPEHGVGPGCSCRTWGSSGRAPSGCAASNCAIYDAPGLETYGSTGAPHEESMSMGTLDQEPVSMVGRTRSSC